MVSSKKKKFPNNAVIDLGSNSIRMLVFRKTKDGKLFQVNKSLRYTKLGQDLSKTGLIGEDAIVRNIEALDEYKSIAEDYDVHHVYVYATNAMREAKNSGDLVERVKDRFGLDIDIITGDQEALYGFLGVSQIRSGEVLIFDIGGGSTELVLGSDKIEDSTSLQLGCVRCSDDFLSDQNHVKREEVEKLYAHARRMLEASLSHFNLPKDYDLVGVGGTITTLAAILKELDIYDSSKIHNTEITLEDVDDLLELFISKNLKQRLRITGLPENRVDTIIAGTTIVKAIFDVTKAKSCFVCDFDNMEGAAFFKFIDESTRDWDRQTYKSKLEAS